MSFQTNVQNAMTRVATESKSLRTLINGNAVDNSALLTTAKGNLVAAINELYGAVGSAGASIDDGATSGISVWSSSKTSTEIAAAAAALVEAAPGTLDTLNELAAALGDDPNFATTITNLVAGKADAVHTHETSDVNGLDTALAGKAPTTHGHTTGEITGLDTALSGKAPTTHSHAITDVTGLQTALNGKASTATATTTATGLVELATNAEVATGTDATRAVTPAGLRSVMGDPEVDLVAVFEAGLT